MNQPQSMALNTSMNTSMTNSQLIGEVVRHKVEDFENFKPLKEKKCLNLIKKDLECFYKDFVKIVFSLQPDSNGNVSELRKFERRMNHIIEKSSDYSDILE